jgi:membrane fusion protein (multidrug efflux system)
MSANDSNPDKSDDQPAEPEQGRSASKNGESAPKKKGDEKGKGDPKPKGPPWYKRPLLVGLLVLAVIVLVVGGALFWRYSSDHASSDDAYIDGTSEQVAAQVAGRVTDVLVDDNQDVKAGQVLVRLDPRDYQSRLDQTRAALSQAEAQLKEAHAQQAVYGAQTEEARANLGTVEANATNASNQLDRYRRLKAANAGAVSDQQMDSANAAATSTAAQLNAARKAVAAAEAQEGYAGSLVAAAEAGIGSARSQVAEAELTLSYTQIKARIDGQVAIKTVSVGNVISAGMPLMAIVPRDVYVTANFKETQLQHMRRGQPVTIKVDAYPDLKLDGHVDSVQAASGQAFSTLPAQNATGNWVKVVQRVPVKIVFDRLPDDPNRRLGPGMSVEVSVKVH